jgi:hypothetical protein
LVSVSTTEVPPVRPESVPIFAVPSQWLARRAPILAYVRGTEARYSAPVMLDGGRLNVMFGIVFKELTILSIAIATVARSFESPHGSVETSIFNPF